MRWMLRILLTLGLSLPVAAQTVETAPVGGLRREPAPAPENPPVFQLDIRQQSETGEPGGTTDLGRPGNGGSNEGVGSSGTGSGDGFGTGSGTGGGFGSGNGAGGDGGFGLGSQQQQPQVTGLIVDARQLDFVPSMSMRLFDPDGNQIYTTPTANQNLNTQMVAVNGTALYATSESQALSLINRIGERPHSITAVRTRGYDLVVSTQDAWDLRQKNQADGFLDNFAVVVIWNPQMARMP